MSKGPLISGQQASVIYQMLVEWLEFMKFQYIPFPSVNYKHDTKIFVLALEKLREPFTIKSKLNQTQRQMLKIIEESFENPHEILAKIKKQLLT